MSSVIFGAQLVQASLLHDHTEHSAECVLWHFHLSDDSEVDHSTQLLKNSSQVLHSPKDISFFSEAPVSPYSSRAPPVTPHL